MLVLPSHTAGEYKAQHGTGRLSNKVSAVERDSGLFNKAIILCHLENPDLDSEEQLHTFIASCRSHNCVKSRGIVSLKVKQIPVEIVWG